MSIREQNAVFVESGQTAGHLTVKLAGGALLCLLAAVTLIANFYPRDEKRVHAAATALTNVEVSSWSIEGALTEACTCTVPCTCNFGEGPSPHHYCYSLYSYDIRKGKYNDVTLDGLHFGGTELKSGRTIFIDERANEQQREALRVIAARVIAHISVAEAQKRAKDGDAELRYAAVKQDYDGRRNHLEVAGIGEFSADYIMGLDKTNPVVVHNNTTWRVSDTIKAKTNVYRVKVGQDSINTKDTNSNQGDFSYTDKTDFGSHEGSNCSSSMSSKAHASGGENWSGM